MNKRIALFLISLLVFTMSFVSCASTNTDYSEDDQYESEKTEDEEGNEEMQIAKESYNGSSLEKLLYSDDWNNAHTNAETFSFNEDGTYDFTIDMAGFLPADEEESGEVYHGQGTWEIDDDMVIMSVGEVEGYSLSEEFKAEQEDYHLTISKVDGFTLLTSSNSDPYTVGGGINYFKLIRVQEYKAYNDAINHE